MPELAITFQSNHQENPDGRIQVALRWVEAGTFTDPQPFTPPLADADLREIHWYLEQFSLWPTGPDYDRAARIERRLPEWGRALLDSLLDDRNASRIWQQFVDSADEGKVITLDATDPRVLRLPWELLADEGGHLFAAGVGLRRRLRKTSASQTRPVQLPVRILFVAARPDEAGFIDPRADAIALLDATAGLGDAVEVEFLYPPTLKALVNRLRDRKAPPVHVVHFDGHGVYDAKQGLGYLLFETEDHKNDRVDAEQLGTLLQQARTPLMVLSACQSAMQQETNPYASVAARLIRAGVGSVLAMNYSVLVVAAHKFVAAFYAGLADGLTVGQAVDEGRFLLYEERERHTLTRRSEQGELVEETVRLTDWFLPALYQQSSDPALFAATVPGTSAVPGTLIIPTRQTYPQVVRLLQTLFNKDDLRQFCFELGVQYDDLPGEGNAAKALSLVELAERENRLDAVVALGRRQRPQADWDAALTPSAAAAALAPSTQHSALSTPHSILPAALPPAPQYGFVGRSRELLALERAFADRPMVVLQGFGGLGKTALAAEAGRWFTRTGRFPGGAAFISVEQGGSLETICSWVGQRVSGDPDWVIHGDGDGDMVARVGRLLAEKPALLILDNFESVLGSEPLMPAEELAALLDAVYQWTVNSPSTGSGNAHSPISGNIQSPISNLHSPRLLITTRDTSFPDARFAPGRDCRHVALQGLATADALALAAAVLDAHSIDRATIPRQALVDLMTHLGGHPLSLNLALPHLREYTPEELTARFEELLPGFVTGKAQERNESLAVSLEFSLRRLGAATRQALPDLAVFQGLCMEDDMLAITEMDEALWRVARRELEQAALMRVESLPNIGPPFLHFHPTLLPYLSTQLSAERRTALEETYWRRYYSVANYLYQTDTQNPHMARAIAVRELPNLRRGVVLALAAGEVEAAVDFADSVARFLDAFGRWRERDGLMAMVGRQLSMVNGQSSIVNPSTSSGQGGQRAAAGITKAEFLVLDRQGDALLQQGRAQQAEQVFRELLARLMAGAAFAADYEIAMTQVRIGRCLEGQGRPLQAIECHQQAIAGFERLSHENKNAKQMMAAVYNDLGDNFAAIGKFDEAETAYESSIEVSKTVDSYRDIGVSQGQLGTLAMQRGDLAAAQKRYHEALDTFRALGEAQMEAVAWHQLGMVAEEARQWAEAERCYREAVQIRERIRDYPLLATTFNQLANVAQGDGRFADAERWYLRAIEVNEQTNNRLELSRNFNNLANLYLAQNRLDEAESYARRALAIKETLDLSAEPWTTYNILARIAAARGQTAVSAQWRRQEQESYAAYAGAAHKLPSWAPQFIQSVALAAQGSQEAQESVANFLPQLEEGGWTNMAASVKRILPGEQDEALLYDGLDYEEAYIIRAILQQLSGAAPPLPAAQPAAAAEEAGDDFTSYLNSVLNGVVAASRPGAPAELRSQLTAATHSLAADANLPPDIRALGQALHAILTGSRTPDLSALPPELTAVVQQVLAAIESV